MKLHCPKGHVSLELEGEMAAASLEAIERGHGPTCVTCGEPLSTLRPFQKTCHPEFGCSCVDVAQLDVKHGQMLVVTAAGMTRDEAARIRDAFEFALREAGHPNVPVLVGPPLELTVIDATEAA